MLRSATTLPATPYGSVGCASSAAASSESWRAWTKAVVCGTWTPLPYGCAPRPRSALAFSSRKRIWSSIELVVPVSAMGSVSLPPRALLCHLKRLLLRSPERERQERHQATGGHQRARRHPTVEEQADAQGGGGE